MLSQKSLPVIKATLPVVGANIQDIAECFYGRMFSAHPELLDGLFNRGNQADGQQQQALAGSIAAFATMLVEHPGHLPEALLSRISHKHVSLGINPDQYQIVHDHLFAAIVEKLGDAVTDEVAAAWEEVYWLMANTLISLERGLYTAVGLSPDTVWRTWRVAERIQETEDVVKITFERIDDRDVKPSLPGQYVTLQMPTLDNKHQPRQYSLITADDGYHRRLAIKRLSEPGKPDGEVSSLLHDNVQIGDELVMSAPFGDVVMDDTDRPVVFASAGIGITPMAGMVSHLSRRHSARQVKFLHAGTSAQTFALREQVTADLASLPHAAMTIWYEKGAENSAPDADVRSGFMDVRSVDLPVGATYYLCGPVAFMQVVREDLLALGVHPRDIQYEVFGPDLWQADFQ